MKLPFFMCLFLIGSSVQAIEKPLVSIITPLFKGEKFIKGFLEDITRQTIFDACELLIVNAHSPENEQEIIDNYCQKYPNIHIITLDYDTTLYHALNIGIKESSADYLYFAAVDNRLHPQTIELMANELERNSEIDCIYNDYLLTKNPNETFEKNSYCWVVNLPEFKPHLLNLCITGPQPLWRKSLHTIFGYFKDDFMASGNWEFWNRVASKGAQFKKINFTGTLIYLNPEGVTTTTQNHIEEKRSQENNWISHNYSKNWQEPKISKALPSYTEKPITIIIASYCNKEWYKANLDSVFSQKYSNFRVIYIDDASHDNTGKLAKEYILQNQYQEKVTLICNENRQGAMKNFYTAIHMCKPHEIIAVLDGDDFFANDQVLTRINQEYQNPNVWLTYGQFSFYPGNDIGFCKQLPDEVIKNNEFREYLYWQTSHLRTFYADLFHRIKKEDFMKDNMFFSMCADVAMMLPMLEMAGSHSRFIPDVLYIYNRATSLNDDKINRALQLAIDLEIRSRNKYQPLKKLFKHSQPKNIYVTPGQWIELFAQGNPIFDRDNGLAPLLKLREELSKKGYNLVQANTLENLEDPELIICFEVPDQKELEHLFKYPYEKRILMLWEPPCVMYENFNTEIHKHFSRIYTWNDDLVDNKKYYKFYYPRLNKMITEIIPYQQKKLATMISCNKKSYHPDELYTARTQVIQFFEGVESNDFDLYGKFWDGNTIKNYKGAIDRKVDTLKHYKFCYCYENIKNIRGYVTEKIFDCFHAGCVPIYLGASNISDYIPKSCFIDRRDFATDQQLYTYLKEMPEHIYNNYIREIQKFLKTTNAARYSIDSFVARMENLIIPKKEQSFYLCTACDSGYFDHLLNLIGSLYKHNFDEIGTFAVFDLGLTQEQIKHLERIEKVTIYPIELTNKDQLTYFMTRTWGKPVRGWYAWKPVCIKQALDIFPDVLWIDAGTTILGPINDLFAHFRQKGYFFHNGSDWSLKQETTNYIIEKFNLDSLENRWMLDEKVKGIEPGLMGITQAIYDDFVIPMYELSKDLKNFIDDGSARGGFGNARHDISLFSILALQNGYPIYHHFENAKDNMYLEVNAQKRPFHIACNSYDVTHSTAIYHSRNDYDLNTYKEYIRYTSI